MGEVDIVRWGLVTYSKCGAWLNEVDQVGKVFGNATGLVVNNRAGEAGVGEIQGHNRQYEFGGYLTVCECMEGEGPFVIMNDTLFRTHNKRGWLGLLKQMPVLDVEGLVLYGDIRRDGNDLMERPNPFLASWIFVVPNRASLEALTEGLKVILMEEERPLSPDYEQFLDHWLNPKRFWGGWHGKKGEDELMRKRQCVLWEHRLNRWLLDAGVELRSVGEWNPGKYNWLRILDRLKTRWKAWMG
jgi:hypothetical protein